ncbi:hypothetical protein FMM05_17830 [Flavobacterium zepuense]|uniref:Uncharacterized protein n=1 Tax=Flavobacterium zepuense TaxID=2593302 RepID=A0A552UVX5_9FLAO|nr:hypothetical protein [Flavobacterium zepuense]TRW22366.1 hypothetical protein FMM05_17830 [Flavobacterium zepuense]
MKLLGLCIIVFTFFNSPELSLVRQNYISAAVSEADADAFHKSFETINESHNNCTLLAYKAASIVLLAKYESGLITKTRLFNRGTDLLEATIKKAPDNYEARLIRLNIQDNVPWITGYTSKIKQDKQFLIKNYAKQPDDLKAFTKQYALQSGAFSQKEKAMFN